MKIKLRLKNGEEQEARRVTLQDEDGTVRTWGIVLDVRLLAEWDLWNYSREGAVWICDSLADSLSLRASCWRGFIAWSFGEIAASSPLAAVLVPSEPIIAAILAGDFARAERLIEETAASWAEDGERIASGSKLIGEWTDVAPRGELVDQITRLAREKQDGRLSAAAERLRGAYQDLLDARRPRQREMMALDRERGGAH